MNLRVRRSVIILIVAGWIAATVWMPSVASAAPGDVIKSWVVSGVTIPFGVGYTTRLWISNVPDPDLNYEFTSDGVSTGRLWPAGWVGSWAADMAYQPGPKLMCQVNVGGNNGIYCWNPETGTVAGSIVGSWTTKSQRGLAYRAADDTFYIGGWLQRIIYHIKGLSWADKGAVISQCTPLEDPGDSTTALAISGLAYNAVSNSLWVATNSVTDTVYELNFDDIHGTCAIVSKLPHPDPGNNGAGLEMDENGNLWMVSQKSATVFLVDSGLSASTPSVAAIAAVVDDGAFRNVGLYQAFKVRLGDIQRSLGAGDSVSALQMLRDLRLRFNGCPDKAELDDWIVGCSKQLAVRTKIDDLIKKLGG
jgi:hypothetical protein